MDQKGEKPGLENKCFSSDGTNGSLKEGSAVGIERETGVYSVMEGIKQSPNFTECEERRGEKDIKMTLEN